MVTTLLKITPILKILWKNQWKKKNFFKLEGNIFKNVIKQILMKKMNVILRKLIIMMIQINKNNNYNNYKQIKQIKMN